MDLLSNLNEAQRLAVTTTEGPVMVMAGAGSGKTKVLTTRISYIIQELGINPSGILAVTFTNKAANEMKERISNMLDMDTKFMWISTFHSFCCRLLRMEIDVLEGYTHNFVIIDEEDALKIIKDIMKAAELTDYKPKEIRKLISNSKNFTNFTINDLDVLETYNYVSKEYELHLKKENLLDFDDLIIKTIELFKKNPNILEKYQRKFQYILVDEFQDTNTLQYNLMFMLSSRHHNIFVVGDDFQSIYSFRGAQIENINKFRRDFLETNLILLEENYRSTTQILNLANCVIKNNPNQIKKVMFSNISEGALPVYYHAESSYDEVMYLIDKIRKYMLSGDNYKDFAIMYRANYISRNFEDSLIRYQIPYKIYGGISFFQRKEIKDMVAYLRVIVNPYDDFSFRRIINEPKRKIGDAIINKLSLVAEENKTSLYNAIPYYTGKGQGADALREFKDIMDTIAINLEMGNLRDVIDLILSETKYEEELKKDQDTYADRIANIKEFKSVLKETEEELEGLPNKEKLIKLLSDLALRSENDENNVDDAVILTTYHQAKGLEFKNVFMVAMEEEIFPSANIYKEEELEEERRICYVGITRAKKRLFLTNAESRFLFGYSRMLAPSRFIKEMDRDLYENATKNLKQVYKEKTSFKPKNVSVVKTESTLTAYSVGDKVNHKIFGDGLVVGIKGDIITVAFPVPVGIKQLKANHPSIRKI